jgi:hypothetical protein
MMESAVYDLMVAKPHEPPDARFTSEQFALYRQGYETALLVALRALQAAERRFGLVERTKRLEAKRKRG